MEKGKRQPNLNYLNNLNVIFVECGGLILLAQTIVLTVLSKLMSDVKEIFQLFVAEQRK